MTERPKILEIACFDLLSAELAAAGGADRIELCENYEAGGTTPSREIICAARERIKIPLYVMIRPRPGSFIYTPAEVEIMHQQILWCKDTGIDGLVLGLLTPARDIDVSNLRELKATAGNMPVTFHRAIDQCADLDSGMTQLTSLGIERVLTSGGTRNAVDHIPEIKIIQKKFGAKLVIMPGGGIRSLNIRYLMETGCQEFHSAAITTTSLRVDVNEVKKLKAALIKGFMK